MTASIHAIRALSQTRFAQRTRKVLRGAFGKSQHAAKVTESIAIPHRTPASVQCDESSVMGGPCDVADMSSCS
jgi:hypothetical protein